MLRIIAAVAAFLLCTLEGSRRSRELSERVSFLSEALLLVGRFSTGIRCAGRTSDELLENEHGSFAELVKAHRETYGDVRAAWEAACGRLPKKREETALLRELGRSLGSADRESALDLLERTAEELTALKARAEAEYSKRGTALLQVGTLCGAGLAILIL